MKKNILTILSLGLLLAGCTSQSNVRGIQRTYMNESGELIVVYTDGTEENVGLIKGQDGADGKDGSDGKNGTDGLDGKDGSNGKDGQDGRDGKDGKDGTNGKDGKDADIYFTWTTETKSLSTGIYVSSGSSAYVSPIQLISNDYFDVSACKLTSYSAQLEGNIKLSNYVKDVSKIVYRFDKAISNGYYQSYYSLPNFPLGDTVNHRVYPDDVRYIDWSLLPEWSFDGTYFYQILSTTELNLNTKDILNYDIDQIQVTGTFLEINI